MMPFFSLVMMCLWGHVSPQILQALMQCALQDIEAAEKGMLNKTMIENLAGLGSWGLYPNNVWKEFLKCLPACKLGNPYDFLMPVKNSLLKMCSKAATMLLPHEIFANIYR